MLIVGREYFFKFICMILIINIREENEERKLQLIANFNI